MLRWLSSFESEHGKRDAEIVEIAKSSEMAVYGVSSLPAIRYGERFLAREEFEDESVFRSILNRVALADGRDVRRDFAIEAR